MPHPIDPIVRTLSQVPPPYRPYSTDIIDIIDSRLEFEYHKQTLSRSINQQIFFLGKIRRYITTYAALQIYKTTILPIFDYADIIYDQDRIGASNMWQKLQNKALRLIYNNYYPNPNRLSTKELHLKANLLPLESRRYLHLLVHAFDLTRIPSNLDNRDILSNPQKRRAIIKNHRCHSAPVYEKH